MVTLTSTNGFFGATAGTALEYDFSQIKWTDTGSGSFDVSGDVGFAAAGLTVDGSYTVELGLTGLAHLDLGKMDTSLELDTATGAVNGDGVVRAHVDTAQFVITDHTLEATGPDAAASYIDLGVHAALNVDATVDAFASYDIYIDDGEVRGNVFDGNLVNLDVTLPLINHLTLADLGGTDGNVLTVALGEYFEAKIDIPEFTYDDVEHTAVDGKPDELTLHGESSPFASIEFGLASFLELGPWGEDFDLGFISAGVEVGLFDAKLVGEANLVQDVTTKSDVEFTMTTSLGETVTGSLGDDVVFDTPEGEGDFEVTADYKLVETVESIMSLKLGAFIDWKLLFGAAFVGIPLLSEKWESEVSALDGRVDLGDLLGLSVSFELTDDTTTYTSDAGEEVYTLHYENFVTAASGLNMTLTTHQVSAVGGNDANHIVGNALNNILTGKGGNDTMAGGDGTDRLTGGTGADSMDGGLGNDMLVYSTSLAGVSVNLATGAASGGDAQGDTITGFESVTGSAKADNLTGNDMANLLIGLRGDDTIAGAGGNDTVVGGAGADSLDGGTGTDMLSYFSSLSGVTVDLATGAASGGDAAGDRISGFEAVTGSALDDRLTGDSMANKLFGLGGNDTLTGAGGSDTLSGGAGADAFLFNAASGAGNIDRISDFNVADDMILLDTSIFSSLGGGSDTNQCGFVANLTGQATTADQHIIYKSDTGLLYYDADGSGAGAHVLFARLAAGLAFTGAEFLIYE